MREPAKKKPGRPELPPDERRDHTVRARVTAAEAAKFDRLGGAEWLRRVLARAEAWRKLDAAIAKATGGTE